MHMTLVHKEQDGVGGHSMSPSGRSDERRFTREYNP